MNLPRKVFAKALTSFGTSTTQIILAANNPHHRLTAISSEAVSLLRRLIAAGGRGVEITTLSPQEIRALNRDIEGTLGIRVRRTRLAGFVILSGNVQIVDQRTNHREAA